MDNAKQIVWATRTRPRWQRWLEVFGVLAGIGYAGITYMMWRESHNNFRIEQQATLNPLIGFAAPSEIKAGKPVQAAVKIVNMGKTSAKKFQGEFDIAIQSNTADVLIDYKKMRTTSFSGLLSGLGGAYDVVVTRSATAYAPQVFTEDEAQGILSGKLYMAVYGRGMYRDVFGNDHWFKICFWKSYAEDSSARAGTCTAYNDTGDGFIPPDGKE